MTGQDTAALAVQAAAPGVTSHDSASMTLTAQKALWDAFFAAKHALEGADWPLVRVIREHDGSHTLACPWCDTEFGTLDSDEDRPDIHAIGVGFETTSVFSIGKVRLGGLVDEPEFYVRMADSSEPETDFVAYTCDACDGTLRLPGEREW